MAESLVAETKSLASTPAAVNAGRMRPALADATLALSKTRTRRRARSLPSPPRTSPKRKEPKRRRRPRPLQPPRLPQNQPNPMAPQAFQYLILFMRSADLLLLCFCKNILVALIVCNGQGTPDRSFVTFVFLVQFCFSLKFTVFLGIMRSMFSFYNVLGLFLKPFTLYTLYYFINICSPYSI